MNNTIYYHWHIGSSNNYLKDFEKNTLPNDFVEVITKSILNNNEKYEHFNCPAFKEWNKNTWIVHQPFDLKFKFDKEIGKIYHIPQGEPDKNYFLIHDSYKEVDYPEIQYKYHFLFWTKAKNIWIELYPHPELTRLGLDLITATFPISSWIRPISLAFKLINHESLINIPKGFPLYYIKFVNKNNFDCKINLEQKEKVPYDILNRFEKESNIKIYAPNKSWNFLINRLTSKCPFLK
jgi:hypothetical protein